MIKTDRLLIVTKVLLIFFTFYFAYDKPNPSGMDILLIILLYNNAFGES